MHGAAIKIISPVFGPLWVFARFTFTGLLINRKLFFRQVLILKESHAICVSVFQYIKHFNDFNIL